METKMLNNQSMMVFQTFGNYALSSEFKNRTQAVRTSIIYSLESS